MTVVALVSISFVLFSFSIKTTTLTQAQCLPDQRHALIQLNQGFHTTHELYSWNASIDCCIWDGITCDEQTGMVTSINLAFRSISGELNPALFNLSSLRYLNLAGNQFHKLILPQTGFERLANLTHLDLSVSGFVGQVPIGISALTKLISLNLSDISNTNTNNTNILYLHDTGLKTLLSKLTKLQDLCLDGVDISLNGSEWGNAILQVGPTLQKLSMANCGLRGNLPDEIFHLTNLIELDLSYNSRLAGQLPDSIGNLQYLSMLDLYNCSFYGEIPMSLFSHPSLKSLTLESNNFNGTLNIDVIKHNKNLKFLFLSNNKLSIIEGKNLNKSFFASFPQLEYLGLASCNLTKFPSFLSYQTNIQYLDISNNTLDGVVPNWLCNKTSIIYLDLSQNFFTKIEEDAHFNALDRLQFVNMYSNKISGPVPLFPPRIRYVDFSYNSLMGEIPLSICNATSLQVLHLSYNNLTGTMPPCLLEDAEFGEVLNLKSNQLSGPLPQNISKGPVPLFPPRIRYVDFSFNYFMGEIPLSICNATSLKVLDLSHNNLTGTMPPCLLEDAEFGEVLNLKSNQLSGPLPQNISKGCKFRTIILSGNRINGSLPRSLMNCNTLELLDLGNNQIVDRFPFWLGNLKILRVLALRSNQFYGTISNMEDKLQTNNFFFPALKVFDISSNRFRGIIPKIVFKNLKAMVNDSDSSTFKIGVSGYYYQNSITVTWKGQETEIKNSLSIFSSLDLSQNEFSGEIPEEIGQLKSLVVLNLSHNALNGPIPSEFSNLQQLQSLDLSSNQLSGPIPQELTSLTFLASLNVSYNNLVGEIPQVPQFSTFLNTSYMGNPRLCGSPLSLQCAAAPSNHGFNKGLPSMSSTDIIGLSVSIGLGLGVGFASVIWALTSWENGREWFNFIVDRFYFRHIPWIVLHLRLAIGRE